ncbi:MAG: cysteine desulfurase family protein [Bacteroidia bacterium]
MNPGIYLDYNSTTPVDKKVLEVMLPYFSEHFGNASSKTHAFGWIAEAAVEKARRQVADAIRCGDQEIIFTSGATEAINLGIKGVFENYTSKGNHIVTVKTEHKAVLDTCKSLEKKGAEITYLDVDREGLIDTDQLRSAIGENTILVAIMYANNETGVVQPVQEIAKIVHEKRSIFFSDATQAIGKTAVDVNEDGIDLLCISAHKLYGPKGAGALYVRRKDPRVSLVPLIEGGGHERGLRSGTLNVPGIVGLGEACEIAQAELWDNNMRLSKLRAKLEHQLLDLPGYRINGSTRFRLYNTSNACFSGIKATALINGLKNVAVATGSACTSASAEPSHVLKAMGMNDEDAYSSIRFSLGKYTTEEEIEEVIGKIKMIYTGKI